MVGFTLEYQTRDGNGLVEMCGDNVKYWRGTGLPEYEGGTEGFTKLYPAIVEEMLKRGIIVELP